LFIKTCLVILLNQNNETMITRKIAYDIYQIFALKENQNLTNEQQIDEVEKIIISTYKKGQRSGHIKAVDICKKALIGLEEANSNLY